MPNKHPTMRDKARAVQMFAPPEAKLPSWVEKSTKRAIHDGARKQEEQLIHFACVDLLKIWGDKILWWHTPNSTWVGGDRTGAQLGYLAKQKRLGAKRGVPDLTVVGKGSKPGEVKLLFFEIKSSKGQTTDEQEAFLSTATKLGATAMVIRDVHELQDALKAAGL